MLIAAVLCLCAAAVSAGFGVRALARPAPATGVQQVLRAVAPTQLAAAVMLSAGGVVALGARPATGLPVLIVCVVGAVGTVGAGAWQGARYTAAAAQREISATPCAGGCATCTRSCR
ncbi:hypothetical protein [Mycobacterium sp.]|jgi:hypothetical protein|uniref:hypothetical protein n=1 Tax=Mycobacterium sp. TaxID=1785 RepID=UPI002D3482CD|nr:hypothetical protein [Mycobacterium sp.]HZA11830.1 hypothetical protein [Mycobacterium sp.]